MDEYQAHVIEQTFDNLGINGNAGYAEIIRSGLIYHGQVGHISRISQVLELKNSQAIRSIAMAEIDTSDKIVKDRLFHFKDIDTVISVDEKISNSLNPTHLDLALCLFRDAKILIADEEKAHTHLTDKISSLEEENKALKKRVSEIETTKFLLAEACLITD
jgi:hypothetical protein